VVSLLFLSLVFCFCFCFGYIFSFWRGCLILKERGKGRRIVGISNILGCRSRNFEDGGVGHIY